uniref:Reticulon n=1 Tax=Cyclopterus lumpus TaxID=8103 RepID=A0A8C3G7Z1_CYCLU
MVTKVVTKMKTNTCVVFTGLVISLASLFQLSAITVLSHLCLGVMCVTFTLRLYYKLLELLRWNPGVHPFQSYLDHDSSLTDKETVMLVEEVVLLIAFAVTEIKRLIFIESMIDSIKFVGLLYLLSYVGVLTSGLTLVITAVIVAFSLPLLYRKQQVSDSFFELQHLLQSWTQKCFECTSCLSFWKQMRIRRMVRAVKAFVKRIKNL